MEDGGGGKEGFWGREVGLEEFECLGGRVEEVWGREWYEGVDVEGVDGVVLCGEEW